MAMDQQSGCCQGFSSSSSASPRLGPAPTSLRLLSSSIRKEETRGRAEEYRAVLHPPECQVESPTGSQESRFWPKSPESAWLTLRHMSPGDQRAGESPTDHCHPWITLNLIFYFLRYLASCPKFFPWLHEMPSLDYIYVWVLLSSTDPFLSTSIPIPYPVHYCSFIVYV